MGHFILQAARSLTLLAVPLAFAQQARVLQPADMFKKVEPSVVIIEAYGPDGKVAKAGSGFLVTSDGRFLTNYHVVQYCKRASVKLANGDIYDNVEVLSIDKRRDIALLKIQAVDLPSLSLGRSSTVEIGHSVYSVSSPLGVLQNTLSQGIVSGIRDMDGYKVFQMSAPISKGSSGGPVFDATGAVIGISTFYVDGGQSLNFAVPIDYARGLMGSQTLQTLASIYEPEPEEVKAPPARPRPEEQPKAQVASAPPPSPSIPTIPDEMRNGSSVYIEKYGMSSWTLEQAEAVLGSPVRHRFFYDPKNNPTGDIYAFSDPTRQFREFELSFDKYTKKMTNMFVYPFNLTWDQCKKIWGDNVKHVKNADGTHMYIYQNRRLNVLTDKDSKVLNFGIYL
jgi:hypothetical protein